MTSYKFGKTNSYEKKDKVYFNIAYDQRDEAKKLGYRWDADKKCWYKWFVHSENVEFHYFINDAFNEPYIYEKYAKMISSIDNKKVEETKNILYSA